MTSTNRMTEAQRMDQVGAPPGQHTADRAGDATALRGRLEFGHGLMARRQAGCEEKLVPIAGEDAPAIARQFIGEVLAPGLRPRPTFAVKTRG